MGYVIVYFHWECQLVRTLISKRLSLHTKELLEINCSGSLQKHEAQRINFVPLWTPYRLFVIFGFGSNKEPVIVVFLFAQFKSRRKNFISQWEVGDLLFQMQILPAALLGSSSINSLIEYCWVTSSQFTDCHVWLTVTNMYRCGDDTYKKKMEKTQKERK